MAENRPQNTSNITTNTVSKPGLITDLNPSYIGNDVYSYARNATRSSREGDLGTMGNEPSNLLCFSAPYKIVGHVKLPKDEVMIFSTDNTNSEIGIGNLERCTYTKLLSLSCLNFNTEHPITGVSKTHFQRGTVVTFTDKHNPVRRIELNKISKIEGCDDILLFKKIQHPCIKLSKGQVGSIPNGTFSVVLAYVVDNQVFSDWYSITNRLSLFSETSSNSIEIEIDDLDTEFEQYSLALVGSYKEPDTGSVTKLAKIVGTYSTKVKRVSVTDFLNPDYIDIKLSDLTVQKRSWQKAGIISSNSNLLLLGDLVTRQEENYQLKALQIRSEYVVEQVLADYYHLDGKDVGYYRDENYDFYIQGVYTSGELTNKYHIAGPRAKSSDLVSAVGSDVYEFDKQFSDCDPKQKIPYWKVNNTAGSVIPYNNEFFCDRRVLGRGEMGHHQSTVLYPDNPEMFGDLAGTPQLFHRTPDESKVPRYEVINGRTYINIIGVRFLNIPPFDDPDIVAYKITRSDRKGGNGTVVARGLVTNMRSYFDNVLNKEIYYNNYTVNDLSPDVYLSSTQTVFKGGKEHNFNPLTSFHLDKFAFYSPHTSFEPKYTLGSELKIEAEEIAEINGKFELVYNHPKQKLMNQFSFWLASAVGFIETALIILGKRTERAEKEAKISAEGVSSGTSDTWRFDREFPINSVEDLVGLDIVSYVSAKILARQFSVSTITAILTVIASLGIKIPYSVMGGIRAAEQIFRVIEDFTGYTDYVYQYNAHALFNRSIPVKAGNKRRRLLRDALYIPSTNVTANGKSIYNKGRERFVYMETNKPITAPLTKDTSRGTISTFKKCDSPFDNITSVGSVYYATSKVPNPNQYGQIGSATSVAMHSCPIPIGEDTPILYGGDCVIERIQIQKRMPFFNQDLSNNSFPPGTEYDYRLYYNIAYTRYWMDSTKYDFSELLSGNRMNFARFSRTTTSKYNLDCKKGDKKSIARIDDAYMYLSNNVVLDFFVEADYNVGFREDTAHPHFGRNNQNLSEIFRSDNLKHEEEFEISLAYRDLYTTEIFAEQQRLDFDPSNPIPSIQPNTVIYSLPSYNLQNIDNWQYFLPNNIFAFSESDYGELTSIHKIDQDRLMFLFSKASPFVSMGRSLLELSNQTITIGDGGLFAQDPRESLPTDNNYGACTSRYAFSNTHLGRYYPSVQQGRIMNFLEAPDDITRQGMSFWCKNYMPIFLYKYFPEYDKDENPISGVGYLTIFDSFNETVYVTKRDFSPKKEYAADIQYSNGTFTYKGLPILLRSQYFNDISWTLSYSPVDKTFISWHDWHPDWTIQMDNHFATVKDKGVWKHNERHDSFCNFYGQDNPFILEILSSSGQTIETIRSIEYILEVSLYKNFGRDKFHIHHENFDGLWVSNTEQMSPLLNLIYKTGNPEIDILYPKKNTTNDVSWDVLYSKEENKYRVNMFWDAVKSRGEFTDDTFHLIATDESGYKQIINPLAIDIDKPEEQRKKFRHYFNKFRFIKTVSGSNKFLFKICNIKKLLSQR